MSRPLIGVSSAFTDYEEYLGLAFARPLTALGALPVHVPLLERPADRAELLERLDGLVLGFGRDIEPARFGGAPPPEPVPYSPHRDAVELPLAREALAAGVPLLGVCRGLQVLNVALGGTLHADLTRIEPPGDTHPHPGDLSHWDRVVEAALAGRPAPPHPSHPIEIVPGSRLAGVLGERAVVNSYHHQAVDRLGDGVRVVARAPDGVVEAIEVPGAPAFALGVQWEAQEDWAPGGTGEALFEALIAAAAERRRRPALALAS